MYFCIMKKLTYLIFALFVLSSCSKPDEPEDLTVYTYTHTNNEIDLFDKLNEFRTNLGLTPFTMVEHVSYKCMEHNEYMIQNNLANNNYFNDRATNIQKVCNATRVGEIIAYNYQTNNSTMNAWINSPCRDVMVNPNVVRVGLSIRENPTNNKKYYTVIFLN